MKKNGKRRKRDIFGELMSGINDMRLHREGKLTMRSVVVDTKPLPPLSAKVIRETRERYKMSRAIFAHHLRTSPRTLELWEQGRSRPNDQAASLIWMVRKYPDTFYRLQNLSD